MHVIAEVTYKCPANCPFCPISKSNDVMSLKDFKEVLELFSKLSRKRLLTISGGEPTTLESLWRYVETARKLGYVVTVATNCYIPERLLEARPDYVQISVDGIESQHNISRKLALWHNVLKVLEWIKESKLNGFIRYTLTKENVEELYMLKMRLDSLKLNVKIFAMPIRGCPDLSPSREDIMKILRDGIAVLPSRCPAGKGQFVVTPDLKVLDCIFNRKVLGKLERFDEDELREVIENGRKLKPYPCGEPYWWSECRSVQSAEKN